MNHAIDPLEEEFNAIKASSATQIGGKDKRHAGMLMEDAEYMTEFGSAVPFITPDKPQVGVYLAITVPNRTWEDCKAEHTK
jgi:hypothetical protein